jgi:hypothetical protein
MKERIRSLWNQHTGFQITMASNTSPTGFRMSMRLAVA